jgi:DNA-directed RNA polymerase
VAGAHVNLVPAEQPADIYAAVAAVVVRMLKRDAEAGSEYSREWLAYGITRKMCKRPVMVLPYGGTRMAFKEYLLAHVFEMEQEHHTARPFAKGLTKAADYLTNILTAAMDETIIGPRVAMKWLRDVAKVVAKEGAPINWTTPTGFWVQQAYPATKDRLVKTKVGDEVMKFVLTEEIDGKFDTRKQAQGISPNFVHSMDASALALTICSANDKGITAFAAIHDSYGTIAADMQLLLDTLREEFVRMYESNDVFGQFREEACGVLADGKKVPALPNTGTLDLKGVLDSDFFFA